MEQQRDISGNSQDSIDARSVMQAKCCSCGTYTKVRRVRGMIGIHCWICEPDKPNAEGGE